ncbi:MAG: 50S ribosomal protein L10 [Candidatus Aenigmatarchaeota archaeon]
MLKKDKPKELERMKSLIAGYSSVGILDMHAFPARQLHAIRETVRGKAVIKMSNKAIIERALNESGKGILIEKMGREPALILTNENPFRMYRILKENRKPAAAKPGQTAINDIAIQKGQTSIPPGPGISTLQKVGLKTSVQGGKIAISADKVVCKAGESITDDMVAVFSLLKIEPMEICLRIESILEDNIVYGKNVLDIEPASYINNLLMGVQQSISLSLECGFLTAETSQLAISRAFREARSLCLSACIPEKEFIADIISKSAITAKILKDMLPTYSETT